MTQKKLNPVPQGSAGRARNCFAVAANVSEIIKNARNFQLKSVAALAALDPAALAALVFLAFGRLAS